MNVTVDFYALEISVKPVYTVKFKPSLAINSLIKGKLISY